MSDKKAHYPQVDPNPDFVAMEKSVLAFWEKGDLFRRSVENRKGAKEFIFYDGPPFANGLPHYGHLLTGYVKDVFARYQTMKGKRVERRFGWDCHGLPAEMGAEKELGISGRQAIIQYGIGKFNEYCRTSVMKYTNEWRDYVTRQARWVDFDNDYKTMDITFMESVLWAFKQLYDKGLVYEAYRVMPYSWAAETPLSNFETKLDNSYREREDKAITVAFELNTPPKGAPKADKYYVLAWTTTPWTLPSNLALAVGKEVEYICCHPGEGRDPGQSTCYIMSVNALGRYPKELSIDMDPGLRRDDVVLKGESLIGLSYHPLFPYFANHKHSFKILDGSSFVTDADGTGIVHMAPGFGEDDQKCCEANGIELVVPVDGQGKFTGEIYDLKYPSPLVGEGGERSEPGEGVSHNKKPPLPNPLPQGERELKLRGLNVIAENVDKFKFGEANERIVSYLKATGQLIKQEQIKHNYPHCWRTDQPLIYRAMPSWYVEVTKFRDRAAAINKDINWIPDHIRDGQMGHMLATAPDWSISRNRFWGTPIPVWRSKSGKIKIFGSIAELEKASGKKITDLHRPYIDEIVIVENGEEYHRVEDVFDCWFESGSMPFAQVHYPFENKEWFDTHFPADFITEYVGQTRGWFNTLIMLATALFGKHPFENCICHGVVLDSETGLKYSKRLKNYKDPMEVMDKFGADALRWLMISSPVMRGLDLAVDPEGKFIRDVVRLAIKPIWNAYNFFCLYANADGIKAKFATDSNDVMDRYILAKCKQAVETIEKSLDAYDTPGACDAISQFFEALNNWYIRRNKERFWKTGIDQDKQAAYDTLYTVLTAMCRAGAPLLPLTLEEIYKGLTGEESVHLASFPEFAQQILGESRLDRPRIGSADSGDDELIAAMDRVQDVCNSGLSIRNQLNIRVRQPLTKLDVVGYNLEGLKPYQNIIEEELNVKKVHIHDAQEMAKFGAFKLQIISSQLGKRLKAEGKEAKMKEIIIAAKNNKWEKTKPGERLVAGEPLRQDEYKQLLEPKPEYKDRAQALSTNDALVILDIELDDNLIAEGIARDMVRLIQQARKDAALNVSDRIRLHLDAPEAINKAVRAHKDYVMEQTLAVELLDKAPEKKTFSSENTIDDKKVVISFAVVI